MVHTHVSALIVFVVTLTIQHYYCFVYPVVAIYRYIYTCVVATSLPYEQDKNRGQFDIETPLSIPFQQVAAAYTCKMRRDLVLYTRYSGVYVYVAVFQPITMRRCMIRVVALMYDHWLKLAKISWKIDKVDKISCTWPFQAKNRYDVTLANRRAPGVCLYLVLICTLFWHQSDQVYLTLAKIQLKTK